MVLALLKAHTFASRTSPTHKAKLAKECAFCSPIKIVFKNFPR